MTYDTQNRWVDAICGLLAVLIVAAILWDAKHDAQRKTDAPKGVPCACGCSNCGDGKCRARGEPCCEKCPCCVTAPAVNKTGYAPPKVGPFVHAEYVAGYWAFRHGQPRNSNPHPWANVYRTQLGEKWYRWDWGWKVGQSDNNSKGG